MTLLWGVVFGLIGLLGGISLGWGWWTVALVFVFAAYGMYNADYDKTPAIFNAKVASILLALAIVAFFLLGGWHVSFSSIAFLVLAGLMTLGQTYEGYFYKEPGEAYGY